LGVMERLVLSDAAWERMVPLIIGRPDQKGSTGRDNRMFVEGVLWIVRTGSPWRKTARSFGPAPLFSCCRFARAYLHAGRNRPATKRETRHGTVSPASLFRRSSVTASTVGPPLAR